MKVNFETRPGQRNLPTYSYQVTVQGCILAVRNTMLYITEHKKVKVFWCLILTSLFLELIIEKLYLILEFKSQLNILKYVSSLFPQQVNNCNSVANIWNTSFSSSESLLIPHKTPQNVELYELWKNRKYSFGFISQLLFPVQILVYDIGPTDWSTPVFWWSNFLFDSK